MTSGTTGRPKAIVHRHDRRWIAHELLRSHLPFVPGANDRVLLMNAYSHGVALLAATWFETGASVELIGGVDVAYADELFARGELTAVFAPPTVLTKLVEGTRHKRIDGIKCIFCGTATLQPALHRAATALFGPVIRVTYGKSEMFNPITVLEMDEAEDYYRDLVTLDAVCLGTAARGVEIEIRDEAGRLCAAGEHGEIHLRSPHMMHGHVDEQGFHELPEGAFHATGDLGYSRRARAAVPRRPRARCDEDRRLQDLSGGDRARAAAGMVVVGIPSAHWGEIIVAVSEDGADHAAGGRGRDRRSRALQASARVPHHRANSAQPAGQGTTFPRARDGARPLCAHRRAVSEVRNALSFQAAKLAGVEPRP